MRLKRTCCAVDLRGRFAGVRDGADKAGGLRGAYLAGLAVSLEVMWDLAMEVLGKGEPVPYARAVEASTAKPPEPSHPEAKRERVAELLGRAGFKASGDGALLRGSRCVASRADFAHGLSQGAGRGRDCAFRPA